VATIIQLVAKLYKVLPARRGLTASPAGLVGYTILFIFIHLAILDCREESAPGDTKMKPGARVLRTIA
jgi:hypothetical protein